MDITSRSSIRVRLLFDDCTPCRPGSVGRRKCWFLLNVGSCRRVTDVEYCIRDTFNLGQSSQIELLVDDFVLPAFESSDIIHENDILRVKLLNDECRREMDSHHDHCDTDIRITHFQRKKKRKKTTKATLRESSSEKGADTATALPAEARTRKAKWSSKSVLKSKRKKHASEDRVTVHGDDPREHGAHKKRNGSDVRERLVNKSVTSGSHHASAQKLSHASGGKLLNGKSRSCLSNDMTPDVGRPVSTSLPSESSGSDSDTEACNQINRAEMQAISKCQTEGNSTKKQFIQNKARYNGCLSSPLTPKIISADVQNGRATQVGPVKNSPSDSTDKPVEEKSMLTDKHVKKLRGPLTKPLNSDMGKTANSEFLGRFDAFPVMKRSTPISTFSSSSTSSSSDSEGKAPLNHAQQPVSNPQKSFVRTSSCTGTVTRGVKKSTAKSSDGHVRFSSDSEDESRGGHPPQSTALAQEDSASRPSVWVPPASENGGFPQDGDPRRENPWTSSQTSLPELIPLNGQSASGTEIPAQDVQCKLLTLAGQAPKSKDYGSFPPLLGAPRAGDIIAYKILELSTSYTPEVSAYKEGEVINFNHSTSMLELKLTEHSMLLAPKRDGGKFELEMDEGAEATTSRHVLVTLPSLIEPKLLS